MLSTIKNISKMNDGPLAFVFFSFASVMFLLFSANRFMDLNSDPSKFIGTLDQYNSYMEFSKFFYAVGMGSSIVFAVGAFYFFVKVSLKFFKR